MHPCHASPYIGMTKVAGSHNIILLRFLDTFYKKAIMDDDLLISIPTPTQDFNDPSIIKIIGVGGGGGNAVANMYREQINGVRYVVCNTDSKALSDSPVPHRVQIGPGWGAGGKPEIGRELAEKNIEAIRSIYDEETKMAFITAGMGGGTGTGAAPIIAHEAMKRDILTIGIVTIPFLFEMWKRIDLALDGVETMANEVDALLVVNNERLRQIYPSLSLPASFKKADETLTKAVRSIVEIITMHGTMNLDFRDVDTCLRGGGVAIMSSGYGKGKNRVTKAIDDALNSPLLNDRDIFKSKALRLAIFFPPEENGSSMLMEEMDEVDAFMKNFREDVDTKWGMSEDENLKDEIKVTILASGFKVMSGIEDEESANIPLTGEQLDEKRRREFRRDNAYGNLKKNKPRRRTYIFEGEDFDNEELVATIENNDVLRRTERDMVKFREISHAGRTFL